MPTALITFASSHGHTARIAHRIAAELERLEVHADVADLGAGDDPGAPDAYDLVVVGASVHAGRHEREVVRWVEDHRGALQHARSAFFSVSLSAAGDDGQAARYVEDFARLTGWAPDRTATFAGALQYRRYGWAMRRLMRRIARSKGISTDTGHDHDYTDWPAVDRFAGDLVRDLRLATPAA